MFTDWTLEEFWDLMPVATRSVRGLFIWDSDKPFETGSSSKSYSVFVPSAYICLMTSVISFTRSLRESFSILSSFLFPYKPGSRAFTGAGR